MWTHFVLSSQDLFENKECLWCRRKCLEKKDPAAKIATLSSADNAHCGTDLPPGNQPHKIRASAPRRSAQTFELYHHQYPLYYVIQPFHMYLSNSFVYWKCNNRSQKLSNLYLFVPKRWNRQSSYQTLSSLYRFWRRKWVYLSPCWSWDFLFSSLLLWIQV